jgi:hypothetical protein
MTRRVLVSHRLPPLRSGNAEIDLWVDQYLQRHVAEVFEQIAYLTPEIGTFDLSSVGGSGTAGTYEIASQVNRYYRIGEFVFVTVDVTLAAAVTGGGAGDLWMSGLPYKAVDNHAAMGAVYTSGVDHAATTNYLVASVVENTTTMNINEIADNAAAAVLPITAVAANDRIIASCAYITDGERS